MAQGMNTLQMDTHILETLGLKHWTYLKGEAVPREEHEAISSLCEKQKQRDAIDEN